MGGLLFIHVLLMKKSISCFSGTRLEKAPKGNSNSPWSLHIGIFQILLSMTSP
jgi:hypothetical protein